MTTMPAQERRRDERRRGDDRRASAPLPAEAADTLTEAQWLAGDVTVPDTGPDGADSRLLTRRALRAVAEGSSTFERLYRLYVGARAAFGVGLLLAQAVASVVATASPVPLMLVSLAYAVQAVALWLLPRFRRAPAEVTRLSRSQWLGTIGVDLAVYATLHVFSPVSTFNYVALLALPLLMGGLLTPRLVALGSAAGVGLMLLLAAGRFALFEGDVAAALTQAGLAGLGFFALTLLASELAARLAREEQAARGSLEVARQQARLNRLVIQEMADGVLVVDNRARVRAANPAARSLLVARGLGPAAPFLLAGVPAWEELTAAVMRAFEERAWPELGRDIPLRFERGATRTLRVRARFTRRRAVDDDADASEALCVLFLEDLRNVQARMRQEKLAAMGRVSAGIAHEIRNPLAAIAQANALLLEDDLPPDQGQLARMVADNVQRLKRIVDDVLQVAPGSAPTLRAIDACAEIGAVCAEWARTEQLPLGGASRLSVRLPREPAGAVFDPEHLRRVLINLLDNAKRHATERPGAIELRLEGAGGQLRLTVASDGPPIPADVERHLFEPFFSTRSRGTGLGLYICRELCERYGAGIEYRLQGAQGVHRNEFVVTMRRASLAQAQTRLHP